jgi:hypothetical protein
MNNYSACVMTGSAHTPTPHFGVRLTFVGLEKVQEKVGLSLRGPKRAMRIVLHSTRIRTRKDVPDHIDRYS